MYGHLRHTLIAESPIHLTSGECRTRFPQGTRVHRAALGAGA
jgi:hypothetical protein